MQSSNATAAAVATPQSLTSPEIEQANVHLDQSRNLANGAIAGLSEAQWRFKPAPEVWSIAENMEHVISVQERLVSIIRDQIPTAPPAPTGRDIQLVDAIIINHLPNRLAKFPSPEALHPKGDWALSEARDRFAANTGKLAACLNSGADLRGHVLESPPLRAISKGEHVLMDGYQWILAASAHTERHVKQILEVRADAGFPSN